MDHAAERLFALASIVSTEKRPERLLDRVLEAVMEVSGAERGFVVLLVDGEPCVRACRPPEAQGRISWTVLARVLAENKPLVFSDVRGDPLLADAGSLHRDRVRTVCAVPLRTPRESLGAIYLDSSAGTFQPGLLTALHAFAGLAAAGIQSARDHLVKPRPCPPVMNGALVAVAPEMRRAVHLVRRFAALPYAVYVHGESGTGKELIARAIHDSSPRKRAPFVAANCGAITGSLAESELFGHVRGAFTGAERDRVGLFAQAHGGTLFLDELEAMPSALQEKLLRVLQNGELRRVGGSTVERVDVRIVSASNADLEAMESTFRRDLFFRLNVLRIDLPPLRERPGDLPILVRRLLARIAVETKTGVRSTSDDALVRLARYSWPGNVRELENALRRACAMSPRDPLEPADFEFLKPSARALLPDAPQTVDNYIRGMVDRFGPTLGFTELAHRLGVSRKTLWNLRKRWGML